MNHQIRLSNGPLLQESQLCSVKVGFPQNENYFFGTFTGKNIPISLKIFQDKRN